MGCSYKNLAVIVGFEPTDPFDGASGLANRRNRPLCHITNFLDLVLLPNNELVRELLNWKQTAAITSLPALH